MLISLTIPGETVPWARARTQGKRFFTPKRQAGFAKVLKDYASEAMGEDLPVDGPVELSVLAVYPFPKSMSAKKRGQPGAEWKHTKPDADNIIKMVMDALEGICWINDSRVCSQHCWKKYGDRPRLQIEARAL